MTTLEDGDFDGDLFAIPGGQVMVVERDGEMEVEVEMEEAGENVCPTGPRSSSGSGCPQTSSVFSVARSAQNG